jgi:ubiquinone/menaquinone biosynthesis C-methylase UbiE
MGNPWLKIPAADYIAHMSSPEVDQLSVLARLLAEALDAYQPADLLLLGCSTGNGLERIDSRVTRHVIGVDINPQYIRLLADRFPNPGFRLTLHAEDVDCCRLEDASVDLAHCALLFEYIDWQPLLPRLARWIRTGGGLSVVLQDSSEGLPAVTPTRFSSLRALEQTFRFVDVARLVAQATASGFTVDLQRVEPMPSGKTFSVVHFRRTGDRG